MSNVKLNGDDVWFDHPEASTIADVVGTIAQELEQDRRIVKVSYNGEDISGKPERHLDLLNGDNVFELETTRAVDLANETLESITEFHGAVVKELSRTVETFRAGSFELANEQLLRCLDGLQVLTRTTHSVGTLYQVTAVDIQAGQQNLEKLTEKISSILEEMVQAQENRDGILLADLIEYELQMLLEDWNVALEYMKTLGAV